jgi:hypothetical protein
VALPDSTRSTFTSLILQQLLLRDAIAIAEEDGWTA